MISIIKIHMQVFALTVNNSLDSSTLSPQQVWDILLLDEWNTIYHCISSTYWLMDNLTLLPKSVIWNVEASSATALQKAIRGWGRVWPSPHHKVGVEGEHKPIFFQTISMTMSDYGLFTCLLSWAPVLDPIEGGWSRLWSTSHSSPITHYLLIWSLPCTWC